MFLVATIVLSIFVVEGAYSERCNGQPVGGKIYCEKSSELMIGFECVNEKCRKSVSSCANEPPGSCLTSLDVCKLLCGPTTFVWPLPNGPTSISRSLALVSFENERSISFNRNIPSVATSSDPDYPVNKPAKLIERLENKIIRHFTKNKSNGIKNREDDGTKLSVTFAFNESSVSLNEGTDESYQLTIKKEGPETRVRISGNNYFGVRHGCETLLQLIVYDSKSDSYLVPDLVSISDKPAFRYRGLLLDTARRYIPVESIKRTLDGMALNKMNTFHWHLTDTQSFPYVSKKYPEMAAIGAYSEKQVYTPDDIKEIVEYARIGGIRVLPEFDAPSHVGEGWQHFVDKNTGRGYLNCFKSTPWLQYCVEPPCGQLNPTVDGVYSVLGDLYEEYSQLFDSDLFHMGGDEVSLQCWNTTEIAKWIASSSFKDKGKNDLHQLWYYFQEKATAELEKSNGGHQRIILWTSSLTKHEEFKNRISPAKHIVHIWEDKSSYHITALLRMGYDLIFSTYDELYLDCGFGNWIADGNNWCSPYSPWQKLYMSNPYAIVEQLGLTLNEQFKKQILGSEATLWSEQADGYNVDGRVWPRVAALAERLWSNPKTGWKEAKSRISFQRERLVSLGISADVLDPTWCLQNDGECV